MVFVIVFRTPIESIPLTSRVASNEVLIWLLHTRNPFVARYLEGNVTSSPCFANCLTHCRYRKTRETFCIAAALVEAFKGNWEEGLFFCGSNVSKVKKIEKVSEVISELFPE